jgi:hypothetical protein
MTIWFQRTRPATARGATHALVIGTSHYRHLPGGAEPRAEIGFNLKQLSTPCTGAMAFARWLRDEYRNPDAPVESIRILLAPSKEERAKLDAVAATAESPTKTNVERALFDWRRECQGDPEGVAILYISGHGLQTGRDASVVLLTDFAATGNVMTNAVDIGRVRHGMAGDDMSQRQFFFVDACRIAPDELTDWADLGDPFGLPSRFKGADYRCSPMFFSSSPDTPAHGQRGSGTLFSQALLQALSGPAAEDGPDDDRQWFVSPFSLQKSLSAGVAQLAAKLGAKQEAVVGGILKPAVFHYFKAPPEVSFTLEINPEAAHARALADLWNAERDDAFFRNERFMTKHLSRQVPAGVYSLDVRIDPPGAPYRDRSGLPCSLLPRRNFTRTIDVL